MSPRDYDILQRQVQELLDKGHIQPSISPGAVPTLIPQKRRFLANVC